MEPFEKLVKFREHTEYEADDAPVSPPAADSAAPRWADPCPILQRPTNRCEPATRRSLSDGDFPIYRAALPNGQRVPILKSLLTSACERNCYYCSCRSGRNFERAAFTPDEMANISAQLYQRGRVQGVFLSSAIAGGGIRTQDRLLAAAEILRTRLHYTGYLHLKIMPGAQQAQIERAMQLADRVSVNLEAPTIQRLAHVAPQKTFLEELLKPLRQIEEIRRQLPAHQGWKSRWPSSTTQFVVGGGGETDLEFMRATQYLYRTLHLSRAYFSAFRPVPDTPLEGQPPTDPWRQYRLYQASFLLKSYPFDVEEMPFTPAGNLPLEIDPKLAWARSHLSENPIEVNRADLPELLRVPGIGQHGAQAILRARRRHPIHSLEDLKSLGVLTTRLAPFVLLNGRRPPVQLALW